MADKCIRCGSTKLIPDVPLLDHYGDMGMSSAPAHVKIKGRPGAWFFKDSVSGNLSVSVCGECGHAEFLVSNYRELYEKYQQSLQQ